MSARIYRSLSASALLLAVSACNVDVVDCNKEDASICRDDFFDGAIDDEDAGSSADAGKTDAGVADDAASDDGSPGDDAGSADGGGDAGTVPSELTIEEFCAARYDAALKWRDAIEAQCPISSTEADLRAAYLSENLLYADGAIDTCVTGTNALITAGTVSYVASAAQACAAAYNAQFAAPPASFPATGFDIGTALGSVGHGAASPSQLPSCRAALVGSLKLGDNCTASVACGGGLRCLTTPGGGKTCQMAVATGGPCNAASDCNDAARCVKSGSSTTGKKCVAKDDLPISLGACDSSAECAEGLYCDTGSTCRTAVAKNICPT